MRKVHALIAGLVLAMTVLTACIPGFPPEEQASPTPVVVTVVVTEAPTEAPPEEATPTLATINLAGPEMAIGSTWPYVDGSLLIAVPGGSFLMGRGGGTDNPQHEVTVDDFWIYRTEVTNQQYARCVAVGGCNAPDVEDNPSYLDRERQNDPVTGVNWHQSRAYCEWVHGRLPTEAEWEKTAAWDDINQIKFIYPWGDGAPTCALSNFNNCFGKTTQVNLFAEGISPYGALSMSGNAYEWVSDVYDPLYYRTSPTDNPQGPDTGERRSIRSGGYRSNKDQVPAAARFFDFPNNHARDLGFRCVVEDPTYFAPFCEGLVDYGWGPGGAPNPGTDYVCPAISVDSAQQSCNDGSTYVTFQSNAPGQTTIGGVGGCSEIAGDASNYPRVFRCTSPGNATIDAICSYSGGDASCTPHYNLDPVSGTCVWDGSSTPGTECPEGYVYDGVNMCCTAVPGSGVNFPLCAVGSTPHEYAPGQFHCVGDFGSPPHASEPYFPPEACGPGYGDLLETSPLYVALSEEQAQPILAPVVADANAGSPLLSISGILTLIGLGLVGWIIRYGRKRSA
jgi:iron(II)-dependent oxidoreductase